MAVAISAFNFFPPCGFGAREFISLSSVTTESSRFIESLDTISIQLSVQRMISDDDLFQGNFERTCQLSLSCAKFKVDVKYEIKLTVIS
jgi:hypothetical protein